MFAFAIPPYGDGSMRFGKLAILAVLVGLAHSASADNLASSSVKDNTPREEFIFFSAERMSRTTFGFCWPDRDGSSPFAFVR
jgi:hypothetical protein